MLQIERAINFTKSYFLLQMSINIDQWRARIGSFIQKLEQQELVALDITDI